MLDQEVIALLDDLGLSGEARTQAETLFAPVQDKVKKAVLAQKDYSRKMDNVRTLEANAKRKEELADADMVAITNFQAGVAKALGVTDVNAAIPKLNEFIQNHATLTAREQQIVNELKTRAEEYGFEFKVPAGTTPNTPVTPKTQATPGFDPSQYVTRDQVANELRGNFPQIAATLHDLSVQHQKLFGTPLENTQELVALSIQSAQDAIKYRDPAREKTPQQIWAEKYNVAGKQREIVEAGVQDRIAKAIEEDRIKRASQNGSPTPNTGIPGSPILANKFAPVVADKTVTTNANQNRGVEGALKNFGTYYGGQSQ